MPIHFQLAREQAGVGGVADGIEEALDGQFLAGATVDIAEGDGFQPVATAGVGHLAVPVHGDGGVGQHPVGHGAAGS